MIKKLINYRYVEYNVRFVKKSDFFMAIKKNAQCFFEQTFHKLSHYLISLMMQNALRRNIIIIILFVKFK